MPEAKTIPVGRESGRRDSSTESERIIMPDPTPKPAEQITAAPPPPAGAAATATAPPKPAKPAAPAKAGTTRRFFLLGLFGSWFAIAWVAFTASMLGMVLG